LRFDDLGKWDLIGPDGAEKSISGLGQQQLTVELEMQTVPRFEMRGLLTTKIRQKI